MSAINRVTTSNTFLQWMSSTDAVVGTVNLLTDGNGSTFVANTNIEISGDANTASLNVKTRANINTLQANTANIANISFAGSGITIPGNVATLNVTSNVYIGKDLFVTGNVTVSGNVILDEIGFDDLTIAGSANIANGLYVAGVSSLANANVAISNLVTLTGANVDISVTANISNANVAVMSGAANTKIYNSIAALQDAAVAYAIALG